MVVSPWAARAEVFDARQDVASDDLTYHVIRSPVLIYRVKPSENPTPIPWVNAEDVSFLLQHVHCVHTALYTHNRKVFQGMTHKIGLGYPRANYAWNT